MSRDKKQGGCTLHLDPAVRISDGQEILRLTLSARSRPQGKGLSDLRDFLDRAHEDIVRGFAAITTSEMHELWGRRDAR